MKKICLALSLALSAFSYSGAYAQPFLSAVFPDIYLPPLGLAAVDAGNTNCHSYGSVTFPSSNVYDVYVHSYDGVSLGGTYNWGLAWSLNDITGGTGFTYDYLSMPLPYAGAVMSRMDVGIVQQATGDVLIAVAFWDPNVGHGLAYYSINPVPPSTLTLVGYVPLSSATTGATNSKINIDVNNLNAFVVTWEENTKIYSVGGVINSGSMPTLGNIFTVTLPDPSVKPDVALCNSTNAGLNAHYVYLTTANPSLGIFVEEAVINFNNVIGAGFAVTPSVEDGVNLGSGLELPRIDCPDNAVDDDWSYVLMDEQPGALHTIFATTRIAGALSYNILNNGSVPAPAAMTDMTTYKNDYPVVAFDRDQNYIHYSWSIWYPTLVGPLGWDRAYVGVMLKNSTNYIDANYWVEEQNNSLNQAILRSVALSGQNDATPDLYSTMTFDNGSGFGAAITCKWVPWTNVGFKNGQTTGISTVANNFKAIVSPNPSSGSFAISIEGGKSPDEYQVEMTDVVGRKLFNIQGGLSQVNNILASKSQQLLAGAYFISIKDKDANKVQTVSVVKQ